MDDLNNALEATPAAAPVPAADPAANPNMLSFRIPNTETDIGVDLSAIPAEVRLALLKKGVQSYIINRVNQVNVKHTKAMEPFTAYDEAMKADALQTAVAKPEGIAPTVDLLAPAAAARKDLYEGNIRTASAPGTTKARVTKDPLVKAVTDVVLREVFEKNKVAKPGYKWTDAVKEVGGDGLAYLDTMIAAKVAEGADAAVLNKFKDDRYVKPARIMLGLDTNKNTKDQSIL